MTDQTIRAFIAIELSEELQRELNRLIKELADAGADVKWVDAGKIHLTLKFLGSVETAQISKIGSLLDEVAARFHPFSVEAREVGAFPRVSSPRVVWVGVREQGEELQKLAKAVEETMEGLGFPKEDRPYSPHLTIGRVRTSRKLSGLAERLQGASFAGTSLETAAGIILFKSTLTPHGPLYEKLHESPFSR